MKSKTEILSAQTLIVGIDIAKYTHWARMTDFRGVDLCKPFKVENSTSGFEGLVKKIIELQSKHNLTELIIGMEPSGHYWRTLGWFLKTNGIKLVGVNPYHVKQLKELEDNSQSKNDKKDAYIIACLIRDGRFFDMYLPENEYADLRLLNRHRQQLLDTKKKTTNILKAIMDEFFPEYAKSILNINNPTSRKVLQTNLFTPMFKN